MALATPHLTKVLRGKYFHLVFTVPDSLNPLFYLNQQLCYSLLFKIAWEVLRDLCHNPRFLGAQTGAVAVLHTWSSTLMYHPHIHMSLFVGFCNIYFLAGFIKSGTLES